jgi:nucleotide-binding universal stress UspA family protein
VAAVLGEAPIDCVAVHGQAVPALLRISTDAQLLVIGEPRRGRLASMRASLVAPQLVQRAACPVVVLPSSA